MFSFGSVFIDVPRVVDEDRVVRELTPNEARLRDLTYQSSIYVDIMEKMYEGETVTKEKLHQRIVIGQIPTMVYSYHCNLRKKNLEERVQAGECRWDQGGIFIITGKERVIVAQQRPNYNFVQVIKQPTTNNTKYKFVSEIRSVAEETGYSVLVQTMISVDDRTIYASLPNIKEAIPIAIVFMALGYGTPQEITSCIDMKYEPGKKFIKYIIQDGARIKTREDALLYISKYPMYAIPKEKQEAYARQVVERELFPHLGITATLNEKARFLGLMVNKLICTFIGVRLDDDRDNVSNKRFETTGILIQELFRAVMDNFVKNIYLQLQKRADIIYAITHCNLLTKTIMSCFKTGNWGSKKTVRMKLGVSQILSRMTFAATLAQPRNVVIPVGKEGKNAKIRQINETQFGFICPAETPEGATCGITTTFSIMTKVSPRISSIVTKEEVMKCPSFILSTENGNTYITLNGNIIGSTIDNEQLIKEVVSIRTRKLIHSTVSIVYDEGDDEIRIFCDEGRLLRPLWVVNNKQIYKGNCISFDTLVDINAIRYIDSNEAEASTIAMTPQHLLGEHVYDFCEIHPSTLLGVCASIIPFPDHSQSPRNCYQSSMAKQALGTPLETFNLRTDNMLYMMDYPQRPLVSTYAAKYMGFNDMASGINCIVAIMPKEGFNQEDSIILNKASIDRGLFNVASYFTLCDEEARNTSTNYQTIEIPNMDIRKKKKNYEFLDENAVVRVGSHVKKGDVIIGKVLTKIGKDGVEEKKDVSICIDSGEEGVVHKIRNTTTIKGYKLVKITIRVIKTPEVGDKFASRAAQKGTCGMIFSQEDMPFTADGITPDIIINPHCIPSRMTINQLMECILGKTCALTGKFGDATPFTSSSTNVSEKLCDNLEKCGYDRHGLETMFNPYTGKQIEAKIFIGPTYYQRLKHMVSDKIHSRARGSVTALMRQPLEGRRREGGLRFGEMERDCMIMHGNSRFLKERLFDMSDPYTVTVCSLCGMISSSQTECKGCKEDKMCIINIPYAAKLLFQELNAMGIKTELMPKKN